MWQCTWCVGHSVGLIVCVRCWNQGGGGSWLWVVGALCVVVEAVKTERRNYLISDDKRTGTGMVQIHVPVPQKNPWVYLYLWCSLVAITIDGKGRRQVLSGQILSPFNFNEPILHVHTFLVCYTKPINLMQMQYKCYYIWGWLAIFMYLCSGHITLKKKKQVFTNLCKTL